MVRLRLVVRHHLAGHPGYRRPGRILRLVEAGVASAALRAARGTFVALGAGFSGSARWLVPRALGAYLFGLVWLGFLFLLDPILFRLGLPSLEGDLAAGRRERLFSLLAAGWVCSWLWEFWNFWAAAKWRYIFPLFGPALTKGKIFEMPVPGYLGFLPFALECFVMSRLRQLGAGMARTCFPAAVAGSNAPPGHGGHSTPMSAPRKFCPILAALAAALLCVLLRPAPAHAAGLNLPPNAKQGLDLLYAGQTEKAAEEFRQIQAAQPDNPLGYLLEAEARWWQIYCEACEIKWNMTLTPYWAVAAPQN